MFTGVCLSTGGWGWGAWSWGWVWSPGMDAWSRGGAWSQGGSGPRGLWSQGGLVPEGWGAWWRPPQMATVVGGTHPTGMHACLCRMLHNHQIWIFKSTPRTESVYSKLCIEKIPFLSDAYRPLVDHISQHALHRGLSAWGCLVRGAWSQGVPGWGCLVPGGVVSQHALRQTPP